MKSIAGLMKLRNTLPPLASNDLFDIALRPFSVKYHLFKIRFRNLFNPNVRTWRKLLSAWRYIQLHVDLDPHTTFQYVATTGERLEAAIFRKHFLQIGNSHSFFDRGGLTIAL